MIKERGETFRNRCLDGSVFRPESFTDCPQPHSWRTAFVWSTHWGSLFEFEGGPTYANNRLTL